MFSPPSGVQRWISTSSTRTRGTSVFLVYLADGFGYIGTFALLLFKTLSSAQMSFEHVFIQASYGYALLLGAGAVASSVYWMSATADDRCAYGVVGQDEDDADIVQTEGAATGVKGALHNKVKPAKAKEAPPEAASC